MNNMIKENLNSLIMESMKAGDKVRTNALRAIKTAIMQWETAKENVGKTLDEATEISIVRKLRDQYSDAAKECNDGKHDELVVENADIAGILTEFLPAPVTEDQILTVLNLQSIPHTKQFMGQLIKVIKGALPGADGKLVAKVVGEHLN